MTTLVRLDGEIVATVGARRFFLSAGVEALAADDATVRLVMLMCSYALRVKAGETPGPYSNDRALQYAKDALADL